MKYLVTTHETVVDKCLYTVEADSADEAEEKVLAGDGEYYSSDWVETLDVEIDSIEPFVK